MKLITVIILLPLPVLLFGQNDSINFTDKNGLKQGKWIGKYAETDCGRPTGDTILFERYYKNGEYHGNITEHWSNGIIHSRGEFKNGHSITRKTFDKNGNPEYIISIIKITEFGAVNYQKEYYPNGILKAEGAFEAGPHDANLIGYWRYYFENGQIESEGLMDASSKINNWKYYSQEGTLLKEVNEGE